MRIIIAILALLFVWLQYKLWFTDGGIFELHQIKQAVSEQRAVNQEMAEQNELLAAEVVDLKLGMVALEERARNELGMIKEGEIFYQVVEPSE